MREQELIDPEHKWLWAISHNDAGKLERIAGPEQTLTGNGSPAVGHAWTGKKSGWPRYPPPRCTPTSSETSSYEPTTVRRGSRRR